MHVSREGDLVTVINVFETKPEQQQELVAQWLRFVESVKEEPGLIGAALHRITDGTRFVNDAQWRSEAGYSRGCRRSTARTWRPVARPPRASIPICTKSSLSLSAKAVDCLSDNRRLRGSMCLLPFSRAYPRRWRDDKQKGVRILWPSPIASLLSCASTTP